MTKHVTTFQRIGDTKNTYKYKEVDVVGGKLEDAIAPVVGQLYVQKSKLGRMAPDILTVTVEAATIEEVAA